MADTRPPSTKHLGHAYRPLIIFIEDRAFRNERLQHCSFASNCLPVRRPSMTLLPCCGTTRANLIYLVPDLARDATGKLILLRLIFFFFLHKKEERSDLPLNFYLRRIYEKFTNISIISSAYTCKYNEWKKEEEKPRWSRSVSIESGLHFLVLSSPVAFQQGIFQEARLRNRSLRASIPDKISGPLLNGSRPIIYDF